MYFVFFSSLLLVAIADIHNRLLPFCRGDISCGIYHCQVTYCSALWQILATHSGAWAQLLSPQVTFVGALQQTLPVPASRKALPEAAGDRPITLWDSVTDASKATWQKRSEYSTGEQDMNPLLQEIFKHADYGYAFWGLLISLWSTSWFWP